MNRTLSRRLLLAAAPPALGGLLWPRSLAAVAGFGAAEPGPAGIADAYPAQEPAVVREVVGKSHFDLDAVRRLVEPRPELARAAWDWGFGDWETALGAASHTGRREIAEFLVAHGARPDLFTFAMLGDLDAVRALVAARPGIQGQPGPHGLTLLSHARAGGEPARGVVAFLEELGGADQEPFELPLDAAEQSLLLGSYAFGAGVDDRFVVALDARDRLSLRRGEDGVSRALFHQGDWEFHPAGAPSARIRFERSGDLAVSLEVHNPALILRAERL